MGSAGYAISADLGDGGDETFESALCDLDGDTFVDLVCARSEIPGLAPNTIFRGLGDGRFAPPIAIGDHNSECVCLVDLDIDGDLDIIFGNLADPGDVFLNDGGDFDATPIPLGTGGVHVIAAADWDGDGVADVAVGRTGSFEIWHGGGDGSFTLVQAVATMATTRDIGVVDVDGDGDLDLVNGTDPGSTNRVYANVGDGHFEPTSATIGTLGVRRFATADFDHDGDLDLLVARVASGLSSGVNAIWLGDGAGNFAESGVDLATDAMAGGCEWLDFDADGDLDVVFATLAEDVLFVNAGGGNFEPARSLGPADHSYDIDAVDLDRDGDPDLVISRGNGLGTRVLLNH